MPAIALPWAVPAIGEGLAWGAGALGTGLAALGIIENKDAIKDGISDFGNWVSNGIQNGIRSWSDAMSPKGPLPPNPNYDVATGRPIAVADATRVAMPLLRYQTPPRPFGATRSVRYDVDGEPIPFPWQAGSPEKPIQLRPVIVKGSRVMRTDGGEASSSTTNDGNTTEAASAAGSSTGTGTASPAPASPEPERNDSTNNKKGFLRRTLGLESRPFSGKSGLGRYGRDALRIGGFWAPAGTAAGAFTIDMMGNIVGAAQEPDSITHEMTFPLTRKRFTPERGILRLLGGQYQTRPVQPVTPADTTRTAQPLVNPTDTVPGQAQPDSTSYNTFDEELNALRQAYGGN